VTLMLCEGESGQGQHAREKGNDDSGHIWLHKKT
jgi:hypothetical protein